MRSIVHLIVELAVVQSPEQAPHRLLGVREDVVHVRREDFGAVILRSLDQYFRTANACRELRFEVRDIAVGVARRPFARCKQAAHLCLAEVAFVDKQFVVDQHALFGDAAAVGRHRSRRDPADVGMVAPGGDECRRLGFLGVEHRNNHSDVRQMGPATIGIIQHISIAGADSAAIAAIAARVDDPADALAHRAEVHRDVRRIGDQRALGVKYRAREVEPLLDVDAGRRRLERDSHFLRDGHEEVVENLEADRIDPGASRLSAVEWNGAGQDERPVA